MAEQQVEKAQENGAKDERWEDTIALNRYLWTKSVEPKHRTCADRTKQPDQEDLKDIKEVVVQLANTNHVQLISFIKKAIQSDSLPSMENALWCLALSFRIPDKKDLKRSIFENFCELVPKPENVLSFVLYMKVLGDNKICYVRSLRKCLCKWYGGRSPSDLLELVYATDQRCDISHTGILQQIHTKFENQDQIEIIRATRKKYDDIKKDAETSNVSKKILKYNDLKRSQELVQALSILRRKDYSYKLVHLPKFALKSSEAIDLILPNLSFTDVLNNLTDFNRRNLLSVQDPISKKISNALQVSNKVIQEAQLNPLHVLGIMKDLERSMTISGSEDDTNTEKKFANPFILKKLQNILNQTLGNQTKTGCRYYLTLDIRKFSKRQSDVVGMKSVECAEAQVVFALKLLKTEKDVMIFSFTDDRNKLKPVAWNAETTFGQAMKLYEAEITEKPKTKENILLPLIKAKENKKKVDVFITFVSSIGRTRGIKAKPPVEDLQNYRNALNLKMTKLVLVNLTRKTADLSFEKKDDSETGILEIVGFNQDSLGVIEGFAKNCFA